MSILIVITRSHFEQRFLKCVYDEEMKVNVKKRIAEGVLIEQVELDERGCICDLFKT